MIMLLLKEQDEKKISGASIFCVAMVAANYLVWTNEVKVVEVQETVLNMKNWKMTA